MMRGVILGVAIALLPFPAAAQTKFQCQVSGDKLSLRVLVTNPYDQETHCQVNCHLNAPNGGTISGSCGKTVPAKAVDFLLCAQERQNKGTYGAVLASSNAECVKPLADTDNDIDEPNEFNRLHKDTLDALKGLKKAN